MFTSYDEIWTTFLTNCKASDLSLPKTTERIYESIHNAVLHYNNRMRTRIICNDAHEALTETLDNDALLILAHYLRLIFLKNEQTYLQSILQPFQKDIGLKNTASQLASIKESLDREEKQIEALIFNAEEDYL